MSRKWPKLLFQPLRPPGASGGVNIENKSVQPVYIHTITPYFGQKSGFWMHLRGYLIGTTLPGHCVDISISFLLEVEGSSTIKLAAILVGYRDL